MTKFKRLENPKVSENDPVKGHYLEGPGVGSPSGPMFKIDVMCLCHVDFAPGESIMSDIAQAIDNVMKKHLAMPNDEIDDISCKQLDLPNIPH